MSASTAPIPADPYAWPWDGVPDPARLVLVAAGWDTHWRARTLDPDTTERVVATLAAAVVALGGSTLWLVHDRPPRAPLTAPDPTPLAPVGVAAAGTDQVAVVTAAGIDGFCDGPLASILRRTGRDQLLLVGHGLEATVHSTMRSANDRGLECLLVTDAAGALDAGHDATTTTTTTAAAGAISSVTMSGGIFGAVASLADVLAGLGATPTRPPSEPPHPQEMP
ncbi:MAG: isochorismatase family protein [Acidimicrobiales bacterium]|nr:isochorismatase family protein [Acidimicrobiales bacterium]